MMLQQPSTIKGLGKATEVAHVRCIHGAGVRGEECDLRYPAHRVRAKAVATFTGIQYKLAAIKCTMQACGLCGIMQHMRG